MRTVLALDGGGVRGIIPALVLERIEARTGTPVAGLFDLVSGTSTGGIVALALARPGPDGGPAHAASELVRLYEERGPEIFRRSFLKTVGSVGGLLDERYPSGPLESVLEDYFAGVRLGDSLLPVLVSAYDIAERNPYFFKSWHPENASVSMCHVARAASAAPTYFEPARVPVEGSLHTLVDGAVFVNNPAMSAYAEARRLFAGEDDFVVVSLGTGSLTRSIPYEEAAGWGIAEWAVPILDLVFDGVSEAVDYQLRHLLGGERFFRFQIDLARGLDDLDDASSGNLRGLKEDAARLLESHEGRLAAVCDLLA